MKRVKSEWIKSIAVALLLTLHVGAKAQCTFKNTAFQSGEFLTYNLYYNWKFVWVKAGNASMYTVLSRYGGQPAYRCSLTTRGNRKVDDMFVLRDTLLCYDSERMEPLYFRKGAREGKRYTVDEVFYSYPSDRCHVKQMRQHSSGKRDWEQHTYNNCVYDMMSIYLRARSFNPTGWKKGHNVDFPIVDGRNCTPARLHFDGKCNVKGDNGHTYRCLRLSYMELDDGKYKRIVDFYVTNDANHVPVRLDMYLKFGSAKAFVVGMRGLRNPVTAQIK